MVTRPRLSNTIPLCFSNGISAMGGGTIIIEGMKLLPFGPFGVVSALLIGSCASLAAVRLHREERTGAMAGTAGALAFILLCFHLMGFADLAGKQLEGTTAIAVFALLALRFAFWFAARILRSDTAARLGGKLPQVELAHYTGLIVGLTLFTRLMPSFPWALAFDAAFCLIAGFFDWSGKFMAPHGASTGDECTMRIVGKRAEVSVFSLTAVVCISVISFLALADVHPPQWSGVLALSLLLIAATTYEILAMVFLESVSPDYSPRVPL